MDDQAALELLGGLACDLGFLERSSTLFSAAAAIREKISVPIPPILRAGYGRDLAAVRRWG